MEFKDKAKHVRKRLMMSQTDFAGIMGVSFAAVNRWENGKTKPNYRQQRKLQEICEKNEITFED